MIRQMLRCLKPLNHCRDIALPTRLYDLLRTKFIKSICHVRFAYGHWQFFIFDFSFFVSPSNLIIHLSIANGVALTALITVAANPPIPAIIRSIGAFLSAITGTLFASLIKSFKNSFCFSFLISACLNCIPCL